MSYPAHYGPLALECGTKYMSDGRCTRASSRVGGSSSPRNAAPVIRRRKVGNWPGGTEPNWATQKLDILSTNRAVTTLLARCLAAGKFAGKGVPTPGRRSPWRHPPRYLREACSPRSGSPSRSRGKDAFAPHPPGQFFAALVFARVCARRSRDSRYLDSRYGFICSSYTRARSGQDCSS